MGWIIEEEGLYHEHEGWVALVLADGRVSASTTRGGVLVDALTDADIAAGREVERFPGTDHVNVLVPWQEVALWRVTCQCGWTGTELPATTDPKYGTRDCPEEIEDRVFLPEWRRHVDPLIALTNLRDLAGQLRDLEQRISEKVRLARTAGASWTDIGYQVGLTKQGAQQRWNSTTD